MNRVTLSILILMACVSHQVSGMETTPTLKTAYQDRFDMGAAIPGPNLRDAEKKLLLDHFDCITPENCMKPGPIQPREGVFTFDRADALVAFAQQNGLKVNAHTLLWHQNCPDWFFEDKGQPAGRDLVLKRMRDHITTQVTRYRGRIFSYDVVNEAISDASNAQDFLRPTKWLQHTGPDYIAEAFKAARQADPNAELYYNDYGIEMPVKRAKAVRLMRDLKAQGVKVDGIGIQGHWSLDRVPFKDIEDSIVAFHAEGLQVMITELDLDMVPRARSGAEVGQRETDGSDPYREGCPPEVLQRQADQYAQFFAILCKHADKISRVTFWGLHDGRSWLNGWPRRRTNHPLLWDRDLQPKPAFESVVTVPVQDRAVHTDNLTAERVRRLFDFDWRFHRGVVAQAQAMAFDDTAWRPLDLPHDFGVEDLPGTDSPIDPKAIGGVDAGFLSNGTGWYRKTFTVPAESRGRRFDLEFEGVYMNADVWLNGEHLGNHPYGYTSFWYDVTDRLRYGAENVLAVEVKNEGRNSRWYTGSGIYRHVWLTAMDPVHMAHWGTSITTPEITDERAVVSVKTRVVNTTKQDRRVLIKTRVLDQQGVLVAETQTEKQFKADADEALAKDLRILSPQRWSPESPVLYTAVIEIFDPADADKPRFLDRVETQFGIRSLAFSVDKGFLLNGQPTLLKGGCMHHGNGPLGTAAYDRAEERRVALMKASGFNAIRCAHNPPSPAFLDACDRLGMLVIDEAFDMWTYEKRPQDYHLYFDQWWQRDIDSMVLRDRNHPCVIMWSTGNEIPERGMPEGVVTSKKLAGYIRKLDPTRPVTSAVNGLNPDKDPYFATLDLAGYNYAVGGDHWQNSLYEEDHKRVPDRIIYCAESYPLDAFGSWMAVKDLPYVIGDFVWTGFDYLGEASIGWLGYPQEGAFYPWTHAFCGDIDICGFVRPQSYYRNVLWQTGQQVSIFVTPPEPSFAQNPKREPWSKWHWHDVVADWNWAGHEGKPLDVTVYCAYEKVELFLNGKSLGTKTTDRSNEWTAQWAVPYEPGVLKAVAYDGLTQVATWDLRTAQTPTQIRLTPDRSTIQADGQDLCYVTVELLDAAGIRHPKADTLVEFTIEGPGTIAAVGSSNPMGTESFQQPHRKAYQGRCLVVVKSETEKETIKLTARANGLKASTVLIVSQ